MRRGDRGVAAAASALASIDVERITRGGPAPSSAGAVGAAVAGGLWIVATLAVGVLRLRHAGAPALLPVLPVVVLVVFAVLAARGASVLRAWHDRAEASRAAAALIVAACSALLAVLALQRGIESSFIAKAFSAISGESIDPSQRMRILAGALEAGYFRPAYLAASFNEPRIGADALRVKSVADDAIEINGTHVSLPIVTGATSLPGKFTTVAYAFRPTDTVAHAISIMTAVETLYADHMSYYSLDREITLDDGIVKPDATFGISDVSDPLGRPSKVNLRQGATQVSGRLPPEVIQRIVRQNFGRFRLCYENGLRKDPTLQGRVAVKLIIDRTGAVSTSSDGGSDLPDTAVVACIVKSFGLLSFPQPEGGIVTVVYPIIFSPS